MGDFDFEFFRNNILLIGVVVLAIFWYLVLLVRKRWRDGFLHKKK